MNELFPPPTAETGKCWCGAWLVDNGTYLHCPVYHPTTDLGTPIATSYSPDAKGLAAELADKAAGRPAPPKRYWTGDLNNMTPSDTHPLLRGHE